MHVWGCSCQNLLATKNASISSSSQPLLSNSVTFYFQLFNVKRELKTNQWLNLRNLDLLRLGDTVPSNKMVQIN